MGAVKWALVLFAVTALALLALAKTIAFLNPPRPGRPAPPILRRVRHALWWTVLLPAALGVALLAITLARG